MADALSFTPVDGIGEVRPGDDLAAIVASLTELADGDVVVVTSKVVSKSLGLATTRAKDELLADETDRVVARREQTVIVRTHHGLTMAAAGIDNSNTGPGTLLPLPVDPDGEARRIRSRLREVTGRTVGVVVSDTAGRAWRVGQTDIAIGCAGIVPVESFAGRTDTHGQPLVVTAPAVADEVAGGAELASGKLGGRPVVVMRGLAAHLLTADDGPGAAAIIRDEDGDLFGLGSRDAVVEALADAGSVVRGFPVTEAEVADLLALAEVPDDVEVTVGETVGVRAPSHRAVEAGMFVQRLLALATAHGRALSAQVDVQP
ncbi:MAG: coenzyme F420-0:L-glutamate ligase [Aeromicrobium sp.]|uniref:coenzyme F420-0:L-glutamate ligase n=1 Tax=Aeromicrobium sp. TaxID=1871063 RepID=UPI0025C446BB|nr:coenzyme F420-0:L-glutamate ligase [Aeromicrobium sp.]MCK5891436.1 coenzyme F420-0:L-glutamate ligase [Aeromicrobium sp.]MDF1704677.1 coenzyme F420-0:L-glutamate ligase [Aeromicrobium sp.]